PRGKPRRVRQVATHVQLLGAPIKHKHLMIF
ncbi:hypothetical protein Csa_023971, partial [Cucumis sativus]